MATTPQPPATIDQIINKLKLLPGYWRLQIANDSGIFYVTDIKQIDACTGELVLEKVPPMSEVIINEMPEE